MNRRPEPQPRPQQLQALAGLLTCFAGHDRAQLVMACGTGKTLVSRWHAEASGAGVTIVFVSSLALLAQSLEEWRSPASWNFSALVVCSDPTTSRGRAERADGDVERPRWATARAKVTTNVHSVAAFLREQRERPRVIFATYHSAPAVAAGLKLAGVRADLAICDEAHRLTGQPREEFRLVLDGHRLPAARRVFMTATPKAVPEAELPGAITMADERLFGPVAHRVSFADAIAAGLLSDYRVLVIGQRPVPGRAQPCRRNEVRVPAAVIDAAERFGVRRMLSLHTRVKAAEDFAASLDAQSTPARVFVRARAVSSRTPASVRSEALHWLGDPVKHPQQLRVLASARCLGEGINVPAVDGLLFAERRTSVVDIVQAVGRALRPAPGKTHATVIIPVELSGDHDDDSALLASDWEPVWAVLRALRAHDARLDDELARPSGPRSGQGGNAGGDRGRQRGDRPLVEFVFPGEAELETFRLRVAHGSAAAWEIFYAAAADWFAAHPGKLMPFSLVWKGRGVGSWAEAQRTAYRRGALPAERVQQLQQLPGWVWERKTAEWSATVRLLERIAAQGPGGKLVESTASPFAGLKTCTQPARRLGVWVAAQRQAYRNGTLPPDLVLELEQVPGWSWNVIGDDAAYVAALAEFVEFAKHSRPPIDAVEHGLPLGRWVWDVRRRHLTGSIHPALVDEITAATPSQWSRGNAKWSWEEAETRWRMTYTALRQFAAREGHASPPVGHVEELEDAALSLQGWVALQRHLRRRGDLDEAHQQALERIPGWVWDGAGRRQDAEPPLELPAGVVHGRAGAAARGCKCEECLGYRRAGVDRYVARRRADAGTGGRRVQAGPARDHLINLQEAYFAGQEDSARSLARNGRAVLAAATGVALSVVRRVLDGSTETVPVEMARRILATTVEEVLAEGCAHLGARGRPVSRGQGRVPAGEPRPALAAVAARGRSPGWVGRGLGRGSHHSAAAAGAAPPAPGGCPVGIPGPTKHTPS